MTEREREKKTFKIDIFFDVCFQKFKAIEK